MLIETKYTKAKYKLLLYVREKIDINDGKGSYKKMFCKIPVYVASEKLMEYVKSLKLHLGDFIEVHGSLCTYPRQYTATTTKAVCECGTPYLYTMNEEYVYASGIYVIQRKKPDMQKISVPVTVEETLLDKESLSKLVARRVKKLEKIRGTICDRTKPKCNARNEYHVIVDIDVLAAEEHWPVLVRDMENSENTLRLTGYVTKKPVYHENESGRYARFPLVVKRKLFVQGEDWDTRKDRLQVLALGDYAEDCRDMIDKRALLSLTATIQDKIRRSERTCQACGKKISIESRNLVVVPYFLLRHTIPEDDYENEAYDEGYDEYDGYGDDV